MANNTQNIQKRRSIPLLVLSLALLCGFVWFLSDASRRALLSRENKVLFLELADPSLQEDWVWPKDATVYVTAYDKETDAREVLPFRLSTPVKKNIPVYGQVPPSCRIDERSVVFYGMEMVGDANPPVFRLVGTVNNPSRSNMPLIGKIGKGKRCRMQAAAGWVRIQTSPMPVSTFLLAMDAPDGVALNGDFAMSPDSVLRMKSVVGPPWPEKYVNIHMDGRQEVWLPLPEGTLPAWTSVILMTEDENGRAYPECFWLAEDYSVKAGQCTDLPFMELHGRDKSFYLKRLSHLMISPTQVELFFSDPNIAEVCLVVIDKLASAIQMVNQGDEEVVHATESGIYTVDVPSDLPNGGLFFLYALAYDASGNFLRYTVSL